MVRQLSSVIAACALVLAIPACGSGGEDETPTAEEPLGGARPYVLVPTAAGVAGLCAAELATTYCSQEDASSAARRCEARGGPGAPPSVVTYAAERSSCRAGTTYPNLAACDQPQADDCSFYRSCLEAAHPCGESGYALVYGERLCYAFIEKRGEFSTEGQRWLRGIRACLQRALVPVLHERATCSTVLDEAYATHPACYTAADNSFCSLPVSDVLALTRILGEDLFSSRALAQMREVAHTCVLRLLGLDRTVETNRPGHIFFRELEAASQNEATMRSFVARE